MRTLLALWCLLGATIIAGQDPVPDWCRSLPRPQYAKLQRIRAAADPWFEVYVASPGVFAIYEPHQSEETISYLITGQSRALLFDTGMGIGDLRSAVAGLTQLPVIVVNSHTHHDHVGSNWQFQTVYGMDTAFTRTNAAGSREAAQGEIAPGEICGKLPPNFDPKAYSTRPWTISHTIKDGERLDLGGRTLDILATPGHTPDAICLFDRANRLLFTGDTYYPGPIWLFAPGTDLDAYAQSIRRLAALAPDVTNVLGAHNAPVAPPSVLPRLVAAFDAVRGGKLQPRTIAGNKATYEVDGLTFVLAARR
jgi:glyoxylase-like metal-dependent hydrolase (beta-lactamase superfamily II)